MITGKTTKYFIAAILLLLFSSTLTVYLWLDLEERAAILANNAQILRDQSLLSSEEIKLREALLVSENERLELNSLVIEGESGAVDLLSDLDIMATNLGVELSIDQLNVIETNETGFDELQIQISVTGNDQTVFNMIRILENLPYSSQVARVDLERNSESQLSRADIMVKLSITENGQ